MNTMLLLALCGVSMLAGWRWRKLTLTGQLAAVLIIGVLACAWSVVRMAGAR